MNDNVNDSNDLNLSDAAPSSDTGKKTRLVVEVPTKLVAGELPVCQSRCGCGGNCCFGGGQ